MTDDPQPADRVVGRVERLLIAPDASVPMEFVTQVTARAAKGLEGDRYFGRLEGRGFYSARPRPGRDLTVVEAEQLEAASDVLGTPITPQDVRRNVVTRGIGLNALVGRTFRIGEVLCEAVSLNQPCEHLQELDGRPLMRTLVNRSGVRVVIHTDGVIRVGDEVLPTET